MPSQVNAFSNRKLEPFMNPEQARSTPVKLTASTTYAAGTILGEVTATPGTYKTYASGNSDGSQVPRMILMYDCITDASSNITYTTTAGQSGGDLGQVHKATPAYYSGTFDTRDLTGLDSGAVNNAGFGRLVEGTVTAGVFRLG